LFSWLQTPDLRYREFAGAREITDSVVIFQQQRASNTPVPQDEPVGAPRHDTQLNEEYPEDQFPDQGETRIEVLSEAPHATRESPPVVIHEEPSPVTVREDARGAGRGPLIIAPEQTSADGGQQAPPAAGGGLLGGAYRENDAPEHGARGSEPQPSPAQDSEQRGTRSLDAVFGRLAEVRGRLPDPRERPRNVPGGGSSSGRPR
jgi:hypothetical protein